MVQIETKKLKIKIFKIRRLKNVFNPSTYYKTCICIVQYQNMK
jgi:hypothetical protein